MQEIVLIPASALPVLVPNTCVLRMFVFFVFDLQIITVICNLIWVGFALDTEAAAEGAAPITDPEAARKN